MELVTSYMILGTKNTLSVSKHLNNYTGREKQLTNESEFFLVIPLPSLLCISKIHHHSY